MGRMSRGPTGLEALFCKLLASIPDDWHRRNDIARYEGNWSSVFYAQVPGVAGRRGGGRRHQPRTAGHGGGAGRQHVPVGVQGGRPGGRKRPPAGAAAGTRSTRATSGACLTHGQRGTAAVERPPLRGQVPSAGPYGPLDRRRDRCRDAGHHRLRRRKRMSPGSPAHLFERAGTFAAGFVGGILSAVASGHGRLPCLPEREECSRRLPRRATRVGATFAAVPTRASRSLRRAENPVHFR